MAGTVGVSYRSDTHTLKVSSRYACVCVCGDRLIQFLDIKKTPFIFVLRPRAIVPAPYSQLRFTLRALGRRRRAPRP